MLSKIGIHVKPALVITVMMNPTKVVVRSVLKLAMLDTRLHMLASANFIVIVVLAMVQMLVRFLFETVCILFTISKPFRILTFVEEEWPSTSGDETEVESEEISSGERQFTLTDNTISVENSVTMFLPEAEDMKEESADDFGMCALKFLRFDRAKGVSGVSLDLNQILKIQKSKTIQTTIGLKPAHRQMTGVSQSPVTGLLQMIGQKFLQRLLLLRRLQIIGTFLNLLKNLFQNPNLCFLMRPLYNQLERI